MSRQRVVVGVSNSAENRQALSWAVAEAGGTGRHLVVCYACPPKSALTSSAAGATMGLLELVEPALARAVAAARLRLGGERVTFVARAGPPGELLVDLVDMVDLLVVGAPARAGWLERRSTTHYVVRHARCPVVVIRPSSRTPDGGLDRPFRGHVVVGVDGSSSAQSALQFGLGYAAAHRRPLVAVNVTPHAETDVWYDDVPPKTHSTVEPAATNLLAQEVEPWQHKYPDVAVKRAILRDRPLEGILRAAEGAALLAVGDSRHGRARRMLGSVSHALLDRSRCPVAVVAALTPMARGPEGR